MCFRCNSNGKTYFKILFYNNNKAEVVEVVVEKTLLRQALQTHRAFLEPWEIISRRHRLPATRLIRGRLLMEQRCPLAFRLIRSPD